MLRQIKAVLMTYLARRTYHLLLLAMIVGYAGGSFASRHYSSRWPITSVLVAGLVTFLVPGSALVTLILFFVQARDQLMGLNARLFPKSRHAHLIAIGVLFFGLTIAISAVFWHRPGTYRPDMYGRVDWYNGISPVGTMLVILALMTLAGYTAWKPWLFPVLAFAIIYIIKDRGGWVSFLTTWWAPSWSTGRYAAMHETRVELQYALRAAVFLANVIALEHLVRVLRPSRQRPKVLANLWLRMITSSPSTKAVPMPSLAAHAPMAGLLTRGRHRRFAVHSHTAPWVLAVAIGVVLAGMMLIARNTHDSDRVMAAIVMLTLVPGVVVAAGWRERWASLGYESLLPSRRDQFVGEIAIALGADLIQFWLAALVTSVLVLAAFSPRSVATGAFVASVGASAMMQVLWLGGIFLASRFRQVAPYLVVLNGSGLVMLLPIFHAWYEPRGPLITFLIMVASVEMTAGLIFLLGALGLWRRADLA